MFKSEIAVLLARYTGLKKEEAENLLEIPPSQEMGDYAFPCFVLAKKEKNAPPEIAKGLARIIKPEPPITEVKAAGPYLNFFVDKNRMAGRIIKDITRCRQCFGSHALNKQKVMVEYPSPNTNKPLHLGHVRNMLLGSSICNVLGFAGYKAIPVNLVNDRGVHICKSMLAYKKWGKGQEPEKKPDQFVGDFYVLYNKKLKSLPELEKEIQEMLRKWEQGDKQTVELWKKMNQWVLEGHDQTYKRYNVHHKKTYYESKTYSHGKQIVMQGLEKGIFYKKDDGSIAVDLQEEGLGEKVLLRSDNTSVYITQDLYLAKKKFDDFKMDKSVYVVGNEQIYHFRVLFKLLEMLGLPYAGQCYHLAYGMIYLPEGKMKSREGTIVDADEIADKIEAVAEQEIKKRHPGIKKAELEKRKKIIGMGALRFFILKYDPMKDFVYDPKESISFEGETGPYVQYAHARICSILRKQKSFSPEKLKHPEFKDDQEFKIIRLMSEFPALVSDAAHNYKPSLIARYALELAQAFNEFYHACPVLKSKGREKDSRLALIWCVRMVLRNALDLLGIEAPEEM